MLGLLFLLLIICTDIYTFKCGEESKQEKHRQERKKSEVVKCITKGAMNNTVYSIINSLDVTGDHQCCISKQFVTSVYLNITERSDFLSSIP